MRPLANYMVKTVCRLCLAVHSCLPFLDFQPSRSCDLPCLALSSSLFLILPLMLCEGLPALTCIDADCVQTYTRTHTGRSCACSNNTHTSHPALKDPVAYEKSQNTHPASKAKTYIPSCFNNPEARAEWMGIGWIGT